MIFLHGQHNFVHDPRTDKGPLGNCFMRAFAIRMALGSARITQAEQQAVVATKIKHRMLEVLGWYDAIFYESLFPQYGFYILASVTHINYRVTQRKFEIFTHVQIKNLHFHVLYSL